MDVFYTSILPEWTALTTNIDRLPTPYHDAAVNYAATILLGGTQDIALAEKVNNDWAADKEMIISSAQGRNLGDVVSPEGFDTAS